MDRYDKAVEKAVATLNDALRARYEARQPKCGCRSAGHELCGSIGLPTEGAPDWFGLTQKYVVCKGTGEPIDPKAFYFVLRPDKDGAAVVALRAYRDALRQHAKHPWDEVLARDLDGILEAPDARS